MTFSIAALCPKTGAFGIGITTSSIAVGARCPFVLAGVGAVLSQHSTDPRLGQQGIELLKAGRPAKDVLEEIKRKAGKLTWRQLAVVDKNGNVAHYTGEDCGPARGAAETKGAVAVGNILKNEGVTQAMIDGYLKKPDAPFAERLLDALDGGLAAGGEPKPLRSAALLTTETYPFAETNLRVDWHDEPLAELRRLWDAYKPQKANYMMRVDNPDKANQG